MSNYFEPALFDFLRDLKQNNNREWFQKNKHIYESKVKQPLLEFIADFAPHLHKIHPRFVADPRPVGGSMFRIYRDVRFSEDKSPYKTQASAHFKHHKASKDVHVPGFYLHLEPGQCFTAAGVPWCCSGSSSNDTLPFRAGFGGGGTLMMTVVRLFGSTTFSTGRRSWPSSGPNACRASPRRRQSA